MGMLTILCTIKTKIPLGNPQDTFHAIESALKSYFNSLINMDSTTTTGTSTNVQQQRTDPTVNSKKKY
jgi:hypothetical protein